MKQILVFGELDFRKNALSGGASKARNIFFFLKKSFPEVKIDPFDFSNWKKNPLSLFVALEKAVSTHSIIIVLPNGEKGLLFCLKFFSREIRLKKVKVFYPVVGGFIANYLAHHRQLLASARSFSGFFCETQGLCNEMRSLGLGNVFYSPVFSNRKKESALNVAQKFSRILDLDYFPVCTFSRVTENKGIGLTCQAILSANKNLKSGKPFHLDIYGKLDPAFEGKMNEYIKLSQGSISYKGILPDDSVIEALSNYGYCVFATYFWGECFPATVLECFMAGLPVVASSWKYNGEIVHEGVTGYLFDLKQNDGLSKTLGKAASAFPGNLFMRENCLKESDEFTEEKALAPLVFALERQLNEM